MKLSILDISTILPGQTRQEALQETLAFASYADTLGYHRFWVAEHHASDYLAGCAPEILIPLIAANTQRLRVGSGAILLNHYSAYKVARIFCTLSELYPERIDLGIGRAGINPVVDFALQQDKTKKLKVDSTVQIAELIAWLNNGFPEGHPFQKYPIRTMPHGPQVHILGSSPWSAKSAAEQGLGYVFGAFLNQRGAQAALDVYRRNFEPDSSVCGLKMPHTILCLNVICADNEADARLQLAPIVLQNALLTEQKFSNIIYSPVDAVKLLGGLPPLEFYKPGSGIIPAFIAGTPAIVEEQLLKIAEDFGVDELMIREIITDRNARYHSYKLLAETFNRTAMLSFNY